MGFKDFSRKSPSVDPRIDRLIDRHVETRQEIGAQAEWVSEINLGLDRTLDEILHIETEWRKWRQLQEQAEMRRSTMIQDQFDDLRQMPVVQQLPARYDDRPLKDQISSLENLALEAIDHIDGVGKRCEQDIRQLRTDLLRVASKLQQLEQQKSKPWYSWLLFWKRK